MLYYSIVYYYIIYITAILFLFYILVKKKLFSFKGFFSSNICIYFNYWKVFLDVFI